MTDVQVLQMPARRFWTMESGINRIMAERDLRQLQLIRAQSKTQSEDVVNRLVDEVGETCEIVRPLMVKGDDDAKEKMQSLME
tara:strand:+ start:6141 stop:6389 length:249 start_codon:yes stop_codon:yes gene_type:complete